LRSTYYTLRLLRGYDEPLLITVSIQRRVLEGGIVEHKFGVMTLSLTSGPKPVWAYPKS
jgi:hypothetical protein